MFNIIQDFTTVFKRDPAARTPLGFLEVLLLYPGFHAIFWHRISHLLYRMYIPFIPRMISQLVRFFTGIEIHPGAKIGPGFFIDHGMGVVIGETAEIGRDVLLYQDVTLGGTGLDRGKRHPTLGNQVVVGAGAKVLGNIRIGNNARIGAGSVVVHAVPDNCTVVGVPAEIVRREGRRITTGNQMLDHGNLPDPVMDLKRKVEYLQREVSFLERKAKGGQGSQSQGRERQPNERQGREHQGHRERSQHRRPYRNHHGPRREQQSGQVQAGQVQPEPIQSDPAQTEPIQPHIDTQNESSQSQSI